MTPRHTPFSKRTSAEQLVLDAYFGDRTSHTLDDAYRILHVEDSESEFTRLQAAAATVLLASVQRQLPQWAIARDGVVTVGRDVRPSRSTLKPQHLFTLNWADSAPGFSWPTAYYATLVPAHARIVVTASADCPETLGWCDIAIGHFSVGDDLIAGSRQVITEHWTFLASFDQTRWAYLFDEGVVDATSAVRQPVHERDSQLQSQRSALARRRRRGRDRRRTCS